MGLTRKINPIEAWAATNSKGEKEEKEKETEEERKRK